MAPVHPVHRCRDNEPRVIDNALIRKCVDYQFPKGEVGRLMRQEGIPFADIKEIRFEYMNILKIDHLWVLKSLTRLQLNNNQIEKIERLETLVNLVELDLSFNAITKIENLDELVKIQKLTFFENKISTLEKMDALTELTIFSVGNNMIDDRENVKYLRRFKNMVSLNMAGNPCSEDNEDDFRTFIVAFMPCVVYYEYVKIGEIERQEGRDIYQRELRDLEKVEDEENAKIAAIKKEEEEAQLNSSSFVEYLNTRHLFDEMFENDPEGKALLEMGEEVQDIYTEFEKQFLQFCQQVFDVGQKHYLIRTEEIQQYTSSVEKAKRDDQEVSIKHMEEFMEMATSVFARVRQLQSDKENNIIDDLDYNDNLIALTNEFDAVTHVTWKALMKLELELYEQLEEVNHALESNLTDMINAFIEQAQAAFTLVRSTEMVYTEALSDVANRFLTATLVSEIELPSIHLKEIMIDKESVLNAISSTHDVHLQVIDSREDVLMHRARHWLKTFISNLYREEVERNRYKLLEINHFLDIKREEFEKLKDAGADADEDSEDEHDF